MTFPIDYAPPYGTGFEDLPAVSTEIDANVANGWTQALVDLKDGVNAIVDETISPPTLGGIYPSFMHGVTVGASVDNAPVINGTPSSGIGVQRLPIGVLLSKSPLINHKRTQLDGSGTDAAVGQPQQGTTIKFDNTAIMPSGNDATVTADGAHWVFDFGVKLHGLAVGNLVMPYGFSHAGFNGGKWVSGALVPFVFQITAKTNTTITIANTTIPAASDSGFVGPVLMLGGDVTAATSSSKMRHLTIDASDIPGSVGYYSNSIQEMAGLEEVTIIGCRLRSVLLDASDPLGNGVHPANFEIDKVRTIASPMLSTQERTDYIGWDEWGGNISNGRVHSLTLVNGSSVVSAVQCRFNKMSGWRHDVHVEDATVGILIGDLWGCTAFEVKKFTGTSNVPTALKIANNANGHPNTQIKISRGYRNGGTDVAYDELNGVLYGTSSGAFPSQWIGTHETDSNGAVKYTSCAGSTSIPWAANTLYLPTQQVLLPSGGRGTVSVMHLSGATFDATERAAWTFVPGGHIEVLAAGTASWKCPAGITQALADVIGGGAGGSGAPTTVTGAQLQVGGPGGGAGAENLFVVSALVAGTSYTTNIPTAVAGGAGAAAGGNPGTVGTDGGDCTFTGPGAVVYRSKGGGRGAAAAASSTTTSGGGVYGMPGVASTTQFAGGNGGAATSTGGNGAVSAQNVVGGGAGANATAASLGGSGGNARTGIGVTVATQNGNTGTVNGANGATATQPGCGGGGGGAGAATGTGGSGGSGGPGQITMRF